MPAVLQRALTVAVLLGLLLACGDDGGSTSAGGSKCVSATPLANEPRLPRELPLTKGLELTEARVKRSSVVVEAVQQTSVRKLYEGLRSSVEAHGYKVIGFDFEGFEAEIFFSRKSVSAGALRLREGPCRGEVTMTLLYDPIDTPAGKRILDTARARFDRRK